VHPIAEREESLRIQLAGASSAITADEAKRGIEGAHAALTDGRGKGYGIGFAPIKNFGSVRGEDATTLCIAVTDGTREANLHVKVSGSRSAVISAREEHTGSWVEDRLYAIAGSIPRDADRYSTILARHPIAL
jgi:hypothetical protein